MNASSPPRKPGLYELPSQPTSWLQPHAMSPRE